MSSLPIWTSSDPRLAAITCSDGRRISVSGNVQHLLSLWITRIFSSLSSFKWINSACLLVNTDPANLVGWTCWTFHWFSVYHVIILNFVRQTNLCAHDTVNYMEPVHFQGFRRFGMKSSSTILC
jgi:hypothetical protein